MADKSQIQQHMHDGPDDHAHHVHGTAAAESEDPVDYVKLNREHYNAIAERFDDIPQVKEAAAKIGQEFVKEAILDKEKTELLDFACGTGAFFCSILF